MTELERRLAFDALSLEYSSLRGELIEKTTRSTQTATLLVAVATALYALTSAQKEDWADPILIIVAGALALIGVWMWGQNRATIGKLSEHVAAVESEINTLINGSTSTVKYMDWETAHQGRTGPSAFLVGGGTARRHSARV
jgi:hypothetical protein